MAIQVEGDLVSLDCPLRVQGNGGTICGCQTRHRFLICVNHRTVGRRCPAGEGVTGASEAIFRQILCDTVGMRGILHRAGTAVGIVLNGVRISAVVQLQYGAAICCDGGGRHTVRVRGVLRKARVSLCDGGYGCACCTRLGLRFLQGIRTIRVLQVMLDDILVIGICCPLSIQRNNSAILRGQVQHRRLVCVNDRPVRRGRPAGEEGTCESEAICRQVLCNTIGMQGVCHITLAAVWIIPDGVRTGLPLCVQSDITCHRIFGEIPLVLAVRILIPIDECNANIFRIQGRLCCVPVVRYGLYCRLVQCLRVTIQIEGNGIRIAAVVQLQYGAAICCDRSGWHTVRVRGVLGEAGVGLCNGRHS